MLKIVKLGDPNQSILFHPTAPVDEFDGVLHMLLDAMHSTMRKADGKGLAAPQVGHSLSAIVLNDSRWPELINPRIVRSRGSERRQEMCLSAPGIVVEVERAREVVVEAQDRNGQPIRASVKGEIARLFQHEIDHLSGIVIMQKAAR